MKFTSLNESFAAFGISEDIDEIDEMEEAFIPVKSWKLFVDRYGNGLETTKDEIMDTASDALDDVVYHKEIPASWNDWSGGDPGEPAYIEGWEKTYEKAIEDAFDTWLDEILHDEEIATPELIKDINKYKPSLFTWFNQNADIPSEERYEEAVFNYYTNYVMDYQEDDGYDDYDYLED